MKNPLPYVVLAVLVLVAAGVLAFFPFGPDADDANRSGDDPHRGAGAPGGAEGSGGVGGDGGDGSGSRIGDGVGVDYRAHWDSAVPDPWPAGTGVDARALRADYAPPAVTSRFPHLAVFVDRACEARRVLPDLHVRIPAVEAATDVRAVVRVVMDAEDTDTVRHEAIQILRRSGYPRLLDVLVTVFARAEESPRFRFFLAQSFEYHARDGAIREALAALNRAALAEDRDVEVRRQCLQNGWRAEDPEVLALLDEPLDDPAFDGMRDLAIRFKAQREGSDAAPAIRPYLDGDGPTRIAAIFVLGQLGDAAAKPALEKLAASEDARTARAAAAALGKMGE